MNFFVLRMTYRVAPKPLFTGDASTVMVKLSDGVGMVIVGVTLKLPVSSEAWVRIPSLPPRHYGEDTSDEEKIDL